MQFFTGIHELHTHPRGDGTGDCQPDEGSCGLTPDQVILLAGTPLKEEATIGRCGVEVLTTLEVVGHEAGGKVHGSLACAGKIKQEEKKNPGREKWWNSTTSTFSIQCPPLTTRRATVPTLKSYVILAFSNKPTSLPKKQMPAIRGNAMEGISIITIKFPHIIKIC
jgi:small subunit ribosomal protein S30e